MRWMCIVLTLALAGCSDDGGTTDQGPVGDVALDGLKTDGPGPSKDGPVPSGDKGLPWPDKGVYKDTKPLSCTPGAANMCNGDKTKFCKNGECTLCPAGFVDCDRQNDCECVGACNGNKCV